MPPPKKEVPFDELDPAIAEVAQLSAAQAIERLLSLSVPDLGDVGAKTAQTKVKKVIKELLVRGGPAGAPAAIKELNSWEGLRPGSGDDAAARTYILFYPMFVAVRDYVSDRLEEFEMSDIGAIAERFVFLGLKIWGSDERITEAQVKWMTKDLSGGDPRRLETMSKPEVPGDMVGSLGLRSVLQGIAYTVLETPSELLTVDACASLAWALAETRILNAPLATKVAKAIIANIDRVQPPDVGRIWHALDVKPWFKDAQSEAYLTEHLVARVQAMKKEDPGLAQILADTASELQRQEER